MNSAGLVDLQVNGFAGIDFNAGPCLTPEAIDHALESMLATGVTTCLPTIITAAPDVLAARLSALDAAITASRLGAAMCPGYHLEGPFLNPGEGYAGCHPASAMALPDYALVLRLEQPLARPILLVTLAPELAGAEAFIRRARAAGKLVAIGHSAAGPAEVRAAAEAGATLSTHLGNGLPRMLPKLDNTLMAQLAEDRLTASLIADGIHLPPHALKVMVRAKGPERCILVTDAVAAAASAPGTYDFAGMVVERDADGTVRVPGARSLAGSSLCLDAAVRNVVAWGVASSEIAVAMAGERPMAMLRPALAAHGLTQDAGEVRWSDAWRVAAVRAPDAMRVYPVA
ncbi:MAG TPA: N-acetylglucosamine-6-phosphate deacetylase [Stellaceae bacterium]|nr:N-acetylglucosamine-6-phosphate deacetylase [Stellaceae bacterium]